MVIFIFRPQSIVIVWHQVARPRIIIFIKTVKNVARRLISGVIVFIRLPLMHCSEFLPLVLDYLILMLYVFGLFLQERIVRNVCFGLSRDILDGDQGVPHRTLQVELHCWDPMLFILFTEMDFEYKQLILEVAVN